MMAGNPFSIILSRTKWINEDGTPTTEFFRFISNLFTITGGSGLTVEQVYVIATQAETDAQTGIANAATAEAEALAAAALAAIAEADAQQALGFATSIRAPLDTTAQDATIRILLAENSALRGAVDELRGQVSQIKTLLFSLSAQHLPSPSLSTGTTGAGAALLGANCPAVTVAHPYSWVQETMTDGTLVYHPVWA